MRGKLKNFYTKTRNYFNLSKNDLILASFPKSGNTWLRFILANIIKEYNRYSQEIDFVSMNNEYILGQSHKWWQHKPHRPFPRIFTTHGEYNRRMKNIIYIIRKPEDVFRSYYFYLRDRKGNKSYPNIKSLLEDKKIGISQWKKHAENYISKADLVIRYEDMLNDTFKEVKKVSDLLSNKFDINLDQRTINKAIEASSRENMRKIEKEKGLPRKKKDNPNYFFVGNKKGRNIEINEYERELINQKTKEIYPKKNCIQ